MSDAIEPGTVPSITKKEANNRKELYFHVLNEMSSLMIRHGVDELTAASQAGNAAAIVCDTVRTHPSASFDPVS